MATLIFCPMCQGPARTERDWKGDDLTVCDAVTPCGYEGDGTMHTDHEQPCRCAQCAARDLFFGE